MNKRRHALSIFTKTPKPGTTKTRLTTKYGGSLSDQEAADLYRATMLDVTTASMRALKICRKTINDSNNNDIYDLFISCTSEKDKNNLRTIFRDELSDTVDICYIIDRGSSFDEHFNDHYRQLFDKGYHSVVCIGGDLPTIYPEFICRAFQWLDYLHSQQGKGAMVIAPCQAAGVSLVGLTANAPMDFSGVFYNMEGISALEAIITIASKHGIPTAMLDTQADVDTMEDLGHTIAIIHAMKYASYFSPDSYVPERTLAWINKMGLVVCTPPNEEHDPRSNIDG
ncbi:MAG: DUF2064 domain-containing protein [Dehalococcoidales bacterium]|nr:DUF2064 domain-containing protein [Dehalococcoidales bacterium]